MITYSPEMAVAIQAARTAGAFLRDHFDDDKKVDEESQNDVKIELDKRSQHLIESILLGAFPDHAVLGEEGTAGNPDSECEWIVDPIDGTVNYYYGIPWYCVSIALRKRGELVLGVIYDPSTDECWHAEKGGLAYKNARPISCSSRDKMAEAIVFVGHGKTDGSKEKGIERFAKIAWQVRKVRNNGSAALAMAYIACGRFDSYVESVISIWDIAAGKVIVEAAGGKVILEPKAESANQFAIIAWNGRIPIIEALGE
jgi:myo-inositol-1(or 4)-monophosphatase